MSSFGHNYLERLNALAIARSKLEGSKSSRPQPLPAPIIIDLTASDDDSLPEHAKCPHQKSTPQQEAKLPGDNSSTLSSSSSHPDTASSATGTSASTPKNIIQSDKCDRRKLVFSISRAQPTAKRGRANFPTSSIDSFNNDIFGTLQGEFRGRPSSTSVDRHPFKTPLGYDFLKFLISQNIYSDEDLANAERRSMCQRYANHLESLNTSRRSCLEACRVQGLVSSSTGGTEWRTRIDKDFNDKSIMRNIPKLCKDELVDGLPMRTICAIGQENDILYEFVVSIKQSNCSAAAGNGAFLTFRGAKVLKETSKWKKDQLKKGKWKPLIASMWNSDYTVTLTGAMFPNDDHSEFIAEDFIDTQDNITFSSKHIDCGLVQLENLYAPLIPAGEKYSSVEYAYTSQQCKLILLESNETDRKTDIVFVVKDFLFSHEPSAWRFDVKEQLNGRPQVVDFTDDATGSPHEIAKSRVSMYVNEVGHSSDLVENVEALNKTDRSITYFINIDKPLAKGDTVELLVNYKESYEQMRIRRGYGKDNLLKGVRGDDDDITRVLRNMHERFEIEDIIESYVPREVVEVVHFLKDRMWGGLKAATSQFATGCSQFEPDLSRQCIARRRMDWITRLLANRLEGLLENRSAVQYQLGMYVFVHEWPPPNGQRSSYTGLATIDSIAEDQHNRKVFDVTTSDNKKIWNVPVAVLTSPESDDMKSAPNRAYAMWIKWKEMQDLQKILDDIEVFRWDPSFYRSINAAASAAAAASATSSSTSSPIHEKISNAIKWDVAEELLFLLEKNKRVPPNFVVSMRCPLSVSFLSNCLLLIADFLLMGKDNEGLLRSLMVLARVAANKLQDIIDRIELSSNQDLSFVGEAAIEKRVVVEPNYEMSFEMFLINPTKLDYWWYATYQIALPLHQVASLIDWEGRYSVENLCNELSLSLSMDARSKFKDWDPLFVE